MKAEPSKADPPKRKRHWFQFSLRMLLIVVTLLAVPLGYVGWQSKIVRERTAMREWMKGMGRIWLRTPDMGSGSIPPVKAPPPFQKLSSLRKWLGDEEVEEIWLPRTIPQSAADQIKATFPEARVAWDSEPTPRS